MKDKKFLYAAVPIIFLLIFLGGFSYSSWLKNTRLSESVEYAFATNVIYTSNFVARAQENVAFFPDNREAGLLKTAAVDVLAARRMAETLSYLDEERAEQWLIVQEVLVFAKEELKDLYEEISEQQSVKNEHIKLLGELYELLGILSKVFPDEAAVKEKECDFYLDMEMLEKARQKKKRI